jgi:hypothetical protein
MPNRFTSSNIDEAIPGRGVRPRWFTVRYKANLSNVQVPDAEIGTATDHGYDPAIASFPTTTTGIPTVCELPTGEGWSASVEAMLFKVVIENNAAANLSVDLAFYEAQHGSTGAVDSWRLIAQRTGLQNDETVQIPTDGGMIMPHVEAITNDDGSAQLYVECRRASAITVGGEAGGGEGFSDIEAEAIGTLVWNTTTRKWDRWGGAGGTPTVTVVQPTASLLNCTEANSTAILADTTAILADTTAILSDTTAILADTTAILADTTAILADTTAIAASVASIDADTTNILADTTAILADTTAILADTTAIAASVASIDGDTTNILADTTAILADTTAILADTTTIASDTTSIDATLTSVVEDHDAVHSDAAIIKVGGKAWAGVPTAVVAGDVCETAYDVTGSQRVYLSNALNYTNDSVTARETPASGINEGSTQISNAAATALAASSTPCIEVTIQNQTGNAVIGIGGSTIAAVANDGILLIGGASITLKIDDVNKVYGYATNNNERLDYTYLTRA